MESAPSHGRTRARSWLAAALTTQGAARSPFAQPPPTLKWTGSSDTVRKPAVSSLCFS